MAAKYNAMLAGIFMAVTMILTSEAAIKFNRDTQICCNATVSSKGTSGGCCGSTLFVDTEALCCGEQVFPYKDLGSGPAWHHGCCFSNSGQAKPYDRRTQECCDGQPLEKPDKDAFYGCCSGKLYNSATHRCCDERLQDLESGNDCCGDKSYNTSTQMCCQRWERNGNNVTREFAELHDLKGNQSSCCGRAPYDPLKEVCCSDQVLPKPEGIDRNDALCCEGRVVDDKTQVCCRDFSNATEKAPKEKAFDRPGPHTLCCGLSVYDGGRNVCCNDTVIPKPAGSDESPGTCCGDQIQTSFRSQICVKGRLIERNSTDLWSCGDDGALYNFHTQKCCFGQVLDNDSDTGCCFSVSRSYDRKKELCCEDGLLPLTEQDIKEGKTDCCEHLHKN